MEKPPTGKIPQYRWMGHVWYYPQFKKTFNQLNDLEKEKVRRVGFETRDKLRSKARELMESEKVV